MLWPMEEGMGGDLVSTNEFLKFGDRVQREPHHARHVGELRLYGKIWKVAEDWFIAINRRLHRLAAIKPGDSRGHGRNAGRFRRKGEAPLAPNLRRIKSPYENGTHRAAKTCWHFPETAFLFPAQSHHPQI